MSLQLLKKGNFWKKVTAVFYLLAIAVAPVESEARLSKGKRTVFARTQPHTAQVQAPQQEAPHSKARMKIRRPAAQPHTAQAQAPQQEAQHSKARMKIRRPAAQPHTAQAQAQAQARQQEAQRRTEQVQEQARQYAAQWAAAQAQAQEQARQYAAQWAAAQEARRAANEERLRQQAADQQPVKTYYDLLEVSSSATEDEIKKAYKKLSLKYHPDRNMDKSEEEKNKFEKMFKKVNNAHSVLRNERENYDRMGHKAFKMFKKTGIDPADPDIFFF